MALFFFSARVGWGVWNDFSGGVGGFGGGERVEFGNCRRGDRN